MLTMFHPLQVGDVLLPNRIIMAPLTRVQARSTHIPNDMMVDYYAQRASSGLMITECTMVDAHACAFMGEGGIYSPAHVSDWKRVTDAVHAKGGPMSNGSYTRESGESRSTTIGCTGGPDGYSSYPTLAYGSPKHPNGIRTEL